ncbi:hypothetical protein ANO11243_078890 [Dothideomycetidae sp. 11243]|nr:hypothetical protein ANO11243_078890 [fungal sp. No.11243]
MADFIRRLPYTPIVLGAALYLLNEGPDSLRVPVLDRLRESLTAFITTAAYDAVWYTNSFLNNSALNNFLSADTSNWNWSQEIAVVTGGCSGLGKGFTERLVARGVRVAVLDVSPAPADFKSNPRITVFTCDVTNPDDVKAVANQVRETVGHPSILVNNAGIAQSHSILNTPPKWLQSIMGVNLMAHWYTAQEFVPHMVAQKKGHIVTLASMASFVASPGMVDYAATKAAVQAFHEGLRAELRSFHQCPEIHMTIVHPIWVATPMVAKYKERLEKAGQQVMEPKVIIDAVANQ